MRWSIIRLIWLRELRDQLRDRRTLFMIVVLPVFLYPIAGFGLMELVGAFLKKASVVEVYGRDNLPPARPPLAGIEEAAVALQQAQAGAPLLYPSLFVKDGDKDRFASAYFDNTSEANTIDVTFVNTLLPADDAAFLDTIDRTALNNRQTDLILVVPPHFKEELEAAQQPKLYILLREGDDRSRLVGTRLNNALARWGAKVTEVRLVRNKLPPDYARPFVIKDSEKDKPLGDRAAADLFGVLVKVFPFILVMWALAGALYPAIDLCAGEKERGTMETLLISPASREEIVWGKFLTIWVFSGATALLNLLSMAITTTQFTGAIKFDTFRLLSLFWGVLLLLPLSAFFSAICLAIGAYARSSKEGQYYLMPLFLMTMPLIFLTLVPDIKLNPFYSMVPITGVALLLQELMAAESPNQIVNLAVYFIPVLGPMMIYSWLALRWAIEQFKREEVLFREAERLDLGLWLRSMFREKEALPSTGQALFCFGLVLVLSRVSVSFGEHLPAIVQQGVRYLAFVATPPLFMALLVTSRPRLALNLRWPPWWAWLAAVGVAVLLFLPGIGYSRILLEQVPAIKAAVAEYKQSQSSGLPAAAAPSVGKQLLAFFVVVVLGSLCEELAFRGFILSGLRRRFKPWTAVLISSFLFALSQMNVFQFVPHFVVGLAMGFLVLRTGSVLPAMLGHLLWNCFFSGPEMFPDAFAYLNYTNSIVEMGSPLLITLSVLSLLAAAGLLYAVWRWTAPAPLSPEYRGEGSKTAVTNPCHRPVLA